MDEKIIEKIRDWAASEPAVVRVWIYGSRLKNTEKSNSDIDVAVEVKRIKELGYCENELSVWMALSPGLEESLSQQLPYTLDLQWYGGEDETPNVHSYLEEYSQQVYP